MQTLARERSRRSRLAALTGGGPATPPPGAVPVPTPFVLLSASAALGYEDLRGLGGDELRETEFGYRKRQVEIFCEHGCEIVL